MAAGRDIMSYYPRIYVDAIPWLQNWPAAGRRRGLRKKLSVRTRWLRRCACTSLGAFQNEKSRFVPSVPQKLPGPPAPIYTRCGHASRSLRSSSRSKLAMLPTRFTKIFISVIIALVCPSLRPSHEFQLTRPCGLHLAQTPHSTRSRRPAPHRDIIHVPCTGELIP